MARGDQLGRQWKIIQLLLTAKTGRSAADIAAHLECHPRTVYRDLEALQVGGFPLYNERVDNRNLWSLLDTVKQQIPVPCSLTELMALYFSRDMIKALQNTVFHDALDTLFQKIKTTLPSDSEKYLQHVRKTLAVSLKQYKDYGKYKEIINRIQSAALNRKTLDVEYFTMGRQKKSRRRIDPYRILFFDNTFYLIGYCHMRKEIRTFTVERVSSATVTDSSFDSPDMAQLDEQLDTGFGIVKGTPEKIRIRFDRSCAGYIKETEWHKSQRILDRPDGSIMFEAEMAVTEELRQWLLSWGAQAEVVAPQALRDAVHRTAQKLLKKYNC